MFYDLKRMTPAERRDFFLDAVRTWERLASEATDCDLHNRCIAHAQHCAELAEREAWPNTDRVHVSQK